MQLCALKDDFVCDNTVVSYEHYCTMLHFLLNPIIARMKSVPLETLLYLKKTMAFNSIQSFSCMFPVMKRVHGTVTCLPAQAANQSVNSDLIQCM